MDVVVWLIVGLVAGALARLFFVAGGPIGSIHGAVAAPIVRRAAGTRRTA